MSRLLSITCQVNDEPYNVNISYLPCEVLHAALSPNACAMVSLDEHHAASMSLMQIENDYANGFFDDGKSSR